MIWAAVVQHYIYKASHFVRSNSDVLKVRLDEPVRRLRRYLRRLGKKSTRLAPERLDPDRIVSSDVRNPCRR